MVAKAMILARDVPKDQHHGCTVGSSHGQPAITPGYAHLVTETDPCTAQQQKDIISTWNMSGIPVK